MPTNDDLKARIQTLQAQAALAREQEVQHALEEFQKAVAEFDLKPEDLFDGIQRRSRRIRRRAPAIAKYRDPARRRLERAWAGTPVDCRPRSDDVPDPGVDMSDGNLSGDASSAFVVCSANKIGASAPSACGCSLI